MMASEAAEDRGWNNAPEITKEQIATLAENGIIVEKPSDEMLVELREIGETMLSEWLEATGDRGKAVIDRYRSMD